jgi:glutamate carboxypeptidase
MTPEGCFAGQRKGSGKFSSIVTGKQAHAGRAFYEGRNAICHLAAMVSDIHRLNDPTSTLTGNVGVFHGGQALNVVPDKAVAKLDVRYQTEADQVNFSNQLSELVERHQHEDYQVDVVGGFSRPTKPLTPETKNLFFLLREVGECLDQKIEWRPSGGCCDGNNLSAKGLPVIDTLGVRGGKIHSSEEFMYLDSIIERSQLSALLLMRLAQQ